MLSYILQDDMRKSNLHNNPKLKLETENTSLFSGLLLQMY